MPESPNIQEMARQALLLHQSGKLAQAEPIYRRILALQPDDPESLHLLGVLLHQSGQTAAGAELILRSVSIQPTFAGLSNLGEILRVLGRHEQALSVLQKAVELNPSWPDAQSNLGLVLMDMNQLKPAEKALARAAQLAPQRGDMFIRLCRVRSRLGDPHGAVIAGRRAVELLPQWAEAWSMLALALAAAKKHAEAIEAADRAVSLAPEIPDVHINRGLALAAADDSAGAEAAYRKAIALNPRYHAGHRRLAALLDGRDEVDASIAALETSLEIQPNDLEGWINLCALRRRARDNAGAARAAESAVKLRPADPAGHGALGLALLALGDYARGFAEYEWRWRCDSFTTTPREFPGSAWDGSDPAGRTIFVHTEQGFGDVIQFVRYIPMLAARGATVLLEAPLLLRTLLPSVEGAARIVPAGVKPPEFDLHVALLSLPKIFKTSLETIPNSVPYLRAAPVKSAAWKGKLDALGADLKVGLVWAGNIKPDATRTCPIAHLAPLADVPGVTFVSLQKRDNPSGADPPPAGMKFVDVADDLRDFSDTAAAMMNLDLIISIDTGSAHLAGALARPTWVMLNWAGDWRWLQDRDDSLWYPTMRLFRQSRKGDWASVTQQVAAALRVWVADHSGSKPGNPAF